MVDAIYDSIASQYDRLFGDENPYYGPITLREKKVFFRWIPFGTRGQKALDIGCGTGLHTQWLVERGYQTFGIDESSEMLRVAISKAKDWSPTPKFVQMDAMSLHDSSLRNHKFHIISCLGSTLNHFRDWRHLSEIVSDALVPRGQFIFSYDNFIDITSSSWLAFNQGPKERAASFKRFLSQVKSAFERKSFNNHWCVRTDDAEIEVPLTYERTNHFRKYLEDAGFKIRSLRGIHAITRFRKDVITASDGSRNDTGIIPNRLQEHFSFAMDNILSERLHFLSANTIGIAVKKT